MTFLEIAGVSLALEGGWAELGGLLEQFSRYEVTTPSSEPVRVSLESAEVDPDDRAPVKLVRTGGWMTAAPDAGRVRIGARADEGAVERLFMHGFAAILAPRGALLVHAAAVEGPQGAIAFLGPSEAGKTTAAGNCPARLVHPDRVAIGVGSTGPWLAPVPFLYGEPRTGSLHPVPLARLAIVRKAKKNALEPVAPRDRARQLCTSVLLPPDPVLARSVLDTVHEVSERVVMSVLHARRDGGFWSLLVTDRQSSIASLQESD